MGWPLPYSDTSTKKLSDQEERKLLTKLDNFFRSSIDHPTWANWREDATKCFKYREGDQWGKKELAILETRHQPPTVNNQISVTIERMVGQFVKQKVRIAYRGRNEPEDRPVAEALSDTLLFIRQNNGLEFEEREMADDGFTGGFGCLETYVTFNDNFEPEIKVKHVDPFEIFVDPFSRRYNWNEDATFICRAKWLDLDEAKELYPDKTKELDGLVNDSSSSGNMASAASVDAFRKDDYVDANRQRVRLVECRYKV